MRSMVASTAALVRPRGGKVGPEALVTGGSARRQRNRASGSTGELTAVPLVAPREALPLRTDSKGLTFASISAVTVAYELLALSHPRIPTISTLVRRRPVPVRLAFVAGIAALLTDHFTAELLP